MIDGTPRGMGGSRSTCEPLLACLTFRGREPMLSPTRALSRCSTMLGLGESGTPGARCLWKLLPGSDWAMRVGSTAKAVPAPSPNKIEPIKNPVCLRMISAPSAGSGAMSKP